VVVTTLIALPLRDKIEITNIAMLYLLSVVIVSVRAGRGPSVAISVLGVAAFDFFCVPPYLTFAVADTEYVLTFMVMLVIGLTITQLTAGMRYQARVAAHRERRAASLYEMSRELSGALTTEQILEIAVQHVHGVFEAPCTVLLPDHTGKLHAPPGERRGALREADLSVAQWVYDHEQTAGLGTGTLPGTGVHYLPLRAPVRARECLALKPRNERLIFVPEQQRLLETFAAQIALALERVHFVEWHRIRSCAWHRSGYVTHCWRPSRTTCARRSPCSPGQPAAWWRKASACRPRRAENWLKPSTTRRCT
jgi:two-component system sensor histidine kinase KdpD